MIIESGTIRAHLDWSVQGVRILIFQTGGVPQPDGRIALRPIAVAKNFEWTPINDTVLYQPMEDTLCLGNRDAQVLMDDLWAAGLRPTEGTGSAGAMTAVQAHLQDMRKLVFEISNLKSEIPQRP